MDPKDRKDKSAEREASEASEAPDGRGPRPTDPNELARWIVEQTTKGAGGDCQQADDLPHSHPQIPPQ